MRLRNALFGAALAFGTIVGGIAAPASAQVTTSDPSQFVQSLSDTAFSTLRNGDRAVARVKFRTLLRQYFAVDQIGDRLIRRWRPTITPAQYAAYKAALPDYLIGTYADRLYQYANAKVEVVRAQPSGPSAAVLTRVTQPGGKPVTAIWTVQDIGGYKVANLTVAGINLAVTQAADFDSFVQRNGFDKLIVFMKSHA